MSVCNAPLGQVVGREFNIDPVTHQDADPVAAHTARDRGEHHMLGVVQLYLEKCIWLLVDHDTCHFNKFFFHSLYLLLLYCPAADFGPVRRSEARRRDSNCDFSTSSVRHRRNHRRRRDCPHVRRHRRSRRVRHRYHRDLRAVWLR